MKYTLLIVLLITLGCREKKAQMRTPWITEARVYSPGDTEWYRKNGVYTDTARTWKAADFGIYPNTGKCYTPLMQHLVDSAYSLPGVTSMDFPSGSYFFSLKFDCTKRRSEVWFRNLAYADSIGSWSFITCKP